MGDGLQSAFSALKKVLKASYRQSVLNDFSIVSKAKFYIVKQEEKEVMGAKVKVHTCEKILPVQINPHNISRNSRKVFRRGKGMAEKLEKGQGISSHDNDDDTLELQLIYDMYDEYMVRTCDGLITGITGVVDKGDFMDISLKNDEATSLEELIKCASCEGEYKSLNYFVLFKWGSLEYFGKITSLSCQYDVFSRWGEPLKASVNVTITQETDDKNKPITVDELDAAGATITSIEKAEMGFNAIALGVSTVLRS